jgi:phosphohistidine phosphatase
MKRLILMRHAKSDWSGMGASDHDRPLNARGTRDAKALGQWLREKGLTPDRVLCSTATRTRQTLDLLELDGAPAVVFTRDLYLADAEEMRAVLKAADGETVLLIAHNPGIGDMAEMVADVVPDADGLHHYPTGATLVTTHQIDSWDALEWGTGHITHIVVPRDLSPQ